MRNERSRPLVVELEAWLREQRAKLSGQSNDRPRPSTTASPAGRHSRASSTTAGCACRTMPPSGSCAAVAVGRKNWTFAGSDEGGRRAAAIYTLIATAKLNDIDPQAWLADVLARLPDHPAKRIHELLPWNWRRKISLPKLRKRTFRSSPKTAYPVAFTGCVRVSSSSRSFWSCLRTRITSRRVLTSKPFPLASK